MATVQVFLSLGMATVQFSEHADLAVGHRMFTIAQVHVHTVDKFHPRAGLYTWRGTGSRPTDEWLILYLAHAELMQRACSAPKPLGMVVPE